MSTLPYASGFATPAEHLASSITRTTKPPVPPSEPPPVDNSLFHSYDQLRLSEMRQAHTGTSPTNMRRQFLSPHKISSIKSDVLKQLSAMHAPPSPQPEEHPMNTLPSDRQERFHTLMLMLKVRAAFRTWQRRGADSRMAVLLRDYQ